MTYPALSDLKTELGISGSGDDTRLTTYVDGAIAYAERYTGRVFVAASATRTFPIARPHVDAGRKTLWTYAEFVAVSQFDIDGVTIDSGEYYLRSYNQQPPYVAIHLHRGSSYFLKDSDGMTHCEVTATWGYSAACPDAVFSAILRLGTWLYRASQQGSGGAVAAASRRGGTVIEASKLPDGVLMILDKYKRAY